MYQIKPHINEKLLFYFHNKELDELYVSVALKTLAEAFVGIFVPIYLLTLGFDFRAIIVYYMVYFGAIAIFMLLGMKLNSWLGLKKTMAIGILGYAAYFWALHVVGDGAFYLIAAVISGLAVGIYYASFHIEFSKFIDKKKEGTQYSIFRIITLVTSVIGPFLGALFIKTISFDFLFFLSLGVMSLSLIPLFLTKDIKVSNFRFSWKKLKIADTTQKGVVYGIDGLLNVISGIFWPLFIFITLKEVFSLGIIVSATSFIMIAFLVVLGRLADKHKEKILKVGVPGYSLSWISRISFLSPIGVFFSNFYSGLTGLMIEIPFNRMIYAKSKKSLDVSHYFLFREAALAVGRIGILVILYFINDIYWAFILAFFATFVYFLLLRKKRKRSES